MPEFFTIHDLYLHFIQIFFLSGIKFFLAPPLAYAMGLTKIQTIIFTSSGGILGVFLFYFSSKWLIFEYYKHRTQIRAIFLRLKPGQWLIQLRERQKQKRLEKPKKIFTKKNKMLVRTIKKYGLWGISILTPVLFSIPLGAFLSARYYHHNSFKTLAFLTSGVLFWSIILTFIIFQF